MIYLVIFVILIVGSMITTYYSDSILKSREELNNNNNNGDILKCIQNVYIGNYTNIHLQNLYNLVDGYPEYRLENMFLKVKDGNTQLYNTNFLDGITIESLKTNTDQEDLFNFLNNIEACSGKNTNFIVYFKDVSYYNNGVIDIPKLNIQLYKTSIERNYTNILNAITTKKIPLIGNIIIDEELNIRYTTLVDIIEEISSSFTQYGLLNNTNKERNMFSSMYGMGSTSFIELYNNSNPKSFIKLNGGLPKFIQSNGSIYIDSYFPYCFNVGNVQDYKCEGGGAVAVDTTFNDSAYTNDFCHKLNQKLYDNGVYTQDTTNTIKYNSSTGVYDITTSTNDSDFQSNIGIEHIYTQCASLSDNDSTIHTYLEDITYLTNKPLIEKLFHGLYYISNYTSLAETTPINKKYDINNWTDINDTKVFSSIKGENGIVLMTDNNSNFLSNELNIPLNVYINPFYPQAPFNFFINNSGVDLMYSILKEDMYNINILKSGNYLKLAMPIVPDIATTNITKVDYDLFKYNFVYTKFIEGVIVY